MEENENVADGLIVIKNPEFTLELRKIGHENYWMDSSLETLEDIRDELIVFVHSLSTSINNRNGGF